MSKITASSVPCFKLFERKLSLPLYQRAYVWDAKDNVEKLLDDVFEHFEGLRERPHSDFEEYFLGNVLLIQEEPEQDGTVRHSVADGQQRLTTLFIILASLVGRVSKPDFIKGRLLKSSEYNEEETQALVSENPGINQILLDIAKGEAFQSSYSEVPPKVLAAYSAARQSVDEWISSFLQDPAILEAFTSHLTRNVRCVEVTYPDAGTALKVFEDVNHKGLKLLQADLLKNIFMKGETSVAQRTAIHREWSAIMEQSKSRKNGDDGYIRRALTAAVMPPLPADRQPKASELVPTLKRVFEDTPQLTVIKKIRQFADAAAQYEQAKYFDGKTSPALIRLTRLPTKSEYVANLVASMGAGLTLEGRDEVCRAIEASAAVAALLRDSKNIVGRTQKFCSVLRSLTDSEIDSFRKEFFSELAPIHKGAQLSAQLQNLRVGSSFSDSTSKKWARYLLWAIEDHLRRQIKDAECIVLRSDGKSVISESQVEHIIPQSAVCDGSEWTEDLVCSLGNLTLLSKRENSVVGTGRYLDKSQHYRSCKLYVASLLPPTLAKADEISRLQSASELSGILGIQDFTPETIRKRTSSIINLLGLIWKLPAGTLKA